MDMPKAQTGENAVKLVGEAFVPGASLLLDGKILTGAAHMLVGAWAKTMLVFDVGDRQEPAQAVREGRRALRGGEGGGQGKLTCRRPERPCGGVSSFFTARRPVVLPVVRGSAPR
jgi:hypothetical protein